MSLGKLTADGTRILCTSFRTALAIALKYSLTNWGQEVVQVLKQRGAVHKTLVCILTKLEMDQANEHF